MGTIASCTVQSGLCSSMTMDDDSGSGDDSGMHDDSGDDST